MQGRHLTATLLGLALTGLVLVLFPPPTRADILSDLIANSGSIRVDNLTFDQFSYSPTGQMPTAANVVVNPIFDTSGNPGLRFSGGFTDAFDGLNAVQLASDAFLSYRVTATGASLNDIHLFGNPQILGLGDGAMSVTETLRDGTQPVQLEIHNVVNNGVSSVKLVDAASFLPVPSLEVVTKDIFAFNLGGFPTQSFVDQTFSRSIPEPGTFFLVGLGAVVLAGYRWRQSRRRPATLDGV
jgi:hypothetical protein